MELLTHTEWLKPIFCLALGFFTCLGLIPLILQWAEYHGGTNHGRDFHHAHSPSVVRLGGDALAVAFAAVALAIPRFGSLSAAGMNTLGVIVFSSLAMFSLGFWDDLRPLGSRFASHVSGFTTNWSEIGSQLRNSLTLRKETR